MIKKEVPESEADVEVKNESEKDVEVKTEDIDMQNLKEVEDEEKDFPSSNTSLMNLTADAGVTTAFSYPVASDIKINITSQVKNTFRFHEIFLVAEIFINFCIFLTNYRLIYFYLQSVVRPGSLSPNDDQNQSKS